MCPNPIFEGTLNIGLKDIQLIAMKHPRVSFMMNIWLLFNLG